MPNGGTLIDELTADHRAVAGLFDRIRAMPPGDPMRKETADRITIELVRHSVAEEVHLYPLVRTHLVNGEKLAEAEIDDHTRVERILKRLETLAVPNTEFNRLVDQLIGEVGRHVAEEERVLFPALVDVCTPHELAELGREVRRTEERAPTRPHPDAQALHTSRLLAPGVGLVDRARDFLSGRGGR